jgi:hypothetical protein
MTYDPDRKYGHDLEGRQVARPLPEDVARERGQFWNVDRDIRERWVGAGAALGFAIVRLLYENGVLAVDRPLLGMGYVAFLVSTHVLAVVAGGGLGFLAASILHQIRRGLRT